MKRSTRNIQWIEQHLRVPEGRDATKPVKLRRWQRRIIRGIYDSPTRTAIISFGRKNAKTTLAAMLLLLHLVGPEARPNSQLYSSALSREQAALLFALAAKMVRMSVDLGEYVTIRDSTKVLTCDELGTIYRALSAEASTTYGLSPVFVVHDELGQVVGPRSELYEALETASGAHESPLSIVISTQAPNDADLLSLLIDDAATGADPLTKLFLYTSNPEADPFKVATIRAANPAYGDFLQADEVLRQADKARRMPSRESAYRNLILNQRVARNDPFVGITLWKANGADPRPGDWAGEVTAAVDLSEMIDLTALVWVGQGGDGAWSVGCRFFTPAEGLIERAKRDRVPYDLWVEQGYLIETPGAAIDYGVVADSLGELCSEYAVELITYDRWHVNQLKRELKLAGLDDLPLDDKGHGQGTRDMTPALQVFEQELLKHGLRHGNHPVLTWCAANARVWRGPAGDRKLDKTKSTGRIDGMVALAMALNRAANLEDDDEPTIAFV